MRSSFTMHKSQFIRTKTNYNKYTSNWWWMNTFILFINDLSYLTLLLIINLVSHTNLSHFRFGWKSFKFFRAQNKGRGWTHQNWCFFGKVPNGLWPPDPPRFRKIILQIFSRIHDQSTVYNGKNLQYKFLDWKWPPPPFGTFPKKHPFWWVHPSLTVSLTVRYFFDDFPKVKDDSKMVFW